MNVLQQAHDALEKARGTISRMQQRQPHIDYCNEVLYGDIAAVKTALSKAIAQGDLLHAVQEHGATIKRISKQGKRLSRRCNARARQGLLSSRVAICGRSSSSTFRQVSDAIVGRYGGHKHCRE